MKLMKFVTRRKGREELMDKIELAMAVFVIGGFIYNKLKKDEEEDDND